MSSLQTEILAVVDSLPDLGVDGFHCRFVPASTPFDQRRAAMRTAAFAEEVAKLLALMAKHPVTRMVPELRVTNRIAEWTKTSIGVAVVALRIAGVELRRLPGNPNAEVIRPRRGKS